MNLPNFRTLSWQSDCLAPRLVSSWSPRPLFTCAYHSAADSAGGHWALRCERCVGHVLCQAPVRALSKATSLSHRAERVSRRFVWSLERSCVSGWSPNMRSMTSSSEVVSTAFRDDQGSDFVPLREVRGNTCQWLCGERYPWSASPEGTQHVR